MSAKRDQCHHYGLINFKSEKYSATVVLEKIGYSFNANPSSQQKDATSFLPD